MAKEELIKRFVEIINKSENLMKAWVFMLIEARTFAPNMPVKEAYELMEQAEAIYLSRLEEGAADES